jgi:hypothetical protein
MSQTQQPVPRVLPGRAERGQAMVFTLVFSAATALVALFLFNSGMMANAKTRIQNAADAGAYSAGVLQARDHNFAAYTNRSMIANQVAVAQLVSMKSYLEDAADQHDRMGSGLLNFEADWVPESKPAWDLAEAVPVPSIRSAYDAVAPTVVKGLDLLIRAHQAAQEAHHAATMVEVVVVADEVVKRNDPNATLMGGAFVVGRTAFQIKNWDNYTDKHSANDDSAAADRFADVVVSDKSTDGFTRNRGSVPNAMWMSTVKPCKWLPNYVSSSTAFGFVHGGGTLLSENKKRWLALDATMGGGYQTCTFWYPCFPAGVCYFTETTPIIDGNWGLGGSGGGVAGANGDYDSRTGYKNNPWLAKQYGGALLVPPPAIPGNIRYYTDGPGDTMDEKGGLQDYYRDIKEFGTTPTDQSPEQNGAQFSVTLEVERKDETIRTSSKFLPNSDKLKMDGGMKAGKMKATASAQAYFYRPTNSSFFTRNSWTRGDGKTELANQFSPYWQSRLADRSTADRAASWALH